MSNRDLADPVSQGASQTSERAEQHTQQAGTSSPQHASQGHETAAVQASSAASAGAADSGTPASETPAAGTTTFPEHTSAGAFMSDASGVRSRRASSPGLVAAGSDVDLAPGAAGGQRPAARVLSEGQVPPGGPLGSGSRLSVGERPSSSQHSLGQHSVGEDVSVEPRRAEAGEVAARRRAPPPCRCSDCAARTSRPDEPVAGGSADDPQLERLCRHTVDMMKLDGATEEEKRRLVKQLQVMVPSGSQQAPEPAEPFPFQLLPIEIKLHIFSFLSPRELCTTVFTVCKEWNAIGKDPVLWQHLSFDADNAISTNSVVRILSFSHLLKSLRLEARRHVDKILFQVADTCKQLRVLTAKFCNGLNSLLLEVLVKHCPHIERVNFEGSHFDDPGCTTVLTGLRQLRALNLSHCLRLEDAELAEIARLCRHLEELNVDGVGFLTDSAVLELVELSCARLTALVLDGENLTDAAFASIGRCRRLEVFCVSFADGMTDAGLAPLAELRGLLRLKIRRGNQVSPSALAGLFREQNMPRLLHLDLSECSNVQDSTVDTITANCPLLTFLALSWCWDITDVGLEYIVTRLRFMRVLDLVGVVRITGRCFRHIPELLPELRYLNLEQCSDIQDVVVERVVRQRPQLQALDYYGDLVVPRPVEMETWAEEVGDNLQQLQLPITINFALLKEDGDGTA